MGTRLAHGPTQTRVRWGLWLLAAGLLAAAAVSADAGATTKPARKDVSAAKSARPAKPVKAVKAVPQRQQLKSKAGALALASSTAEAINAAQLDMAARVLTGSADCEFNQHISVLPDDGAPGWFTVVHKNGRYRMLPQETQTGAVRLEDKTSGMVWLQIPSKSMLMNARLGQRLVDSCLHAEQRAALLAPGAADASAAGGLGIEVPSGALAAADGPPTRTTDGPAVTLAAPPTVAPGLMPADEPAVSTPATPGLDTVSASADSPG